MKPVPAALALQMRMLEPRVLLDAAAMATAAHGMAEQHLPPVPEPVPAPHDLLQALAQVAPGPAQDVKPVPDARATALPAAATAPEAAPHEVYFIDSAVENIPALISTLGPHAEVHVLAADRDGVEQIAQALAGRSDIGAIHILSHGDTAALQLGNASFTVQSMQGSYRDELATIGNALTSDGDILIYGCDFGQGTAGESAVQTLARLTGADVAASTDDTGAASLGGDWVLERQVGTIETTAVSAAAWDHLMVAPVLDATPALTYNGAEDAPPPTAGAAVGALVSDFTVGMSDADPGAVKGVAIVGNVATNGTWWYTVDGGATWAQVGTVSNASALLLPDAPASRLYFQPNANFSGSAGNALTLRAWDQSTGVAGTKSNINTIAGAVSAASDTVAVTVAAVNDAPILNTAAFNVSRATEDDGQSAPVGDPNTPPVRAGTATTTFALSVNDADVGGSVAAGIAVTGADNTNGQWWYSVDAGATWSQLTGASDANALLMARSTTNRLFFQPNADWNGEATLTVRAWDQSVGVSGQFFDSTAAGGTTAFSATTATGTATITPVGDIVADNIGGANAAQEDTPKVFNPIAGTGGAAADTFESTSAQITAIAGQAIAVGGSVTLPEGVVTLGTDGQTLTFLGNPDFVGNATFSYTVTSGAVTETANITLAVAEVADSPRIDLDGTTDGNDFAGSFDARSTLGEQISITDPENNNLVSMTITLAGASAADRLALTNPVTGITSSYDSATGVLTLTGNATLATYQQALQQVVFSTTSSSTTPRTISVQAVSAATPTASNVAVATLTPQDSDADGVANAGDIDDDNDGIIDFNETGTGEMRTVNVTEGLGGGRQSGDFRDQGFVVSANSNTTFALLNSQVNVIGHRGDSDGRLIWEGSNALMFTLMNREGPYTSDSVSIQADPSPSGSVTIVAFDIDGNEIYRSSQPDSRTYTVNTSMTLGNRPIHRLAVWNPNGTTAFDQFTARLIPSADSDNDGIVDRLDIDADNDGITDNVEAQATAAYRPPSGQSAAMIDVDRDGLDDRYDAAVGDLTPEGSVGLVPVDTDSDGTNDFVDGDSDSDGRSDIAERGDGQPTSLTSTTDTDGDGLLDIFEHGSVSDGYYVHDDNITASGTDLAATVVAFNLADSDDDTADNGSGAVPLTNDLDWRDRDPLAPRPPAIDLNSTVDAPGTRDYRTSQAGGDTPPINIATPTADVSDYLENDISQMTIAVAGVLDGNSEIVNIGGVDFALATDATRTITVGGVNMQVAYTVAAGFVITNTDGGVLPQAALDALVRGMTYRNTLPAVTDGARTLTFVVSDTSGLASGPAVATIDVPTNTAPVPEDPGIPEQPFDPSTNTYTATTTEDEPFIGRVIATDEDDDTLTFAVGSQPANGTVTVDAATGAYSYTPIGDFNGLDPFVLTVTDGNSEPVDMTVNMTVTAVPDIVDDTVSTPVDTPIDVAFDANDTFENPVRALTAIDGGAIVVGTPVAVANGTVTLAANGVLTFTPASQFTGTTSFTYTVTSGGVTETATVTVNITPANDPPVPGNPEIPGQTFGPEGGDYTAATVEDTPFNGQVIATDADGDVLTYALTTPPAHGVITLDPATGTYTYTPTADFNGVDTFLVTVSDGNGGTALLPVTMNVTPVSDAVDDTIDTSRDTPITFNVLTGTNGASVDNFENGDQAVTALTQGNGGTVSLSADGTLVYTPNAGFRGTDTFTYTVTSGGVTETATVTVNVIPFNAPPKPEDPNAPDPRVPSVPGQTFDPGTGNYVARTTEDIPFRGQVVASDADGDTLTYTLTGGPSHGTVTIDPDTGDYVYTPTADFNGTDSFVVTVSDGHGASVQSTVTMAVTPIPDAVDDSVATDSFTPVIIGFDANDNFEDPGHRLTGINDTPIAAGSPLAVANGVIVLNADGTLTFTPTPGFVGTTAFTYTVTSGGVTETATVTVVVSPGNDVPPFPEWPQVFPPEDGEPPLDIPGGRREVPSTTFGMPPTYRPPIDNGQTGLSTGATYYTGPVQEALEKISSLNGTSLISAEGIILRAVNDIRSLDGVDERETDDRGGPRSEGVFDRSAWRARNPLDAAPALISSLRLPDGSWLEMQVEANRAWIDVVDDGTGAVVSNVRVTLASGVAPPWLHAQGSHISIDRPPGTQRVTLRVQVRHTNGSTRAFMVDVNFETSEMRLRGGGTARDTGARRDVRGDATPLMAPPSFMAQLSQASRVQGIDPALMAPLAAISAR